MRHLTLLLAIALATPCFAGEVTITVGPRGQYPHLAQTYSSLTAILTSATPM